MTRRIAVVGLGAVGSMTLWELARRGADVTGFEAQNIGSDRTGFGGETRLFRLAYQEGACFSQLLRRSRELWLECNEAFAAQVFVPCGALTIGSARGAYVADLEASVKEAGAEVERLDAGALGERFPQHRLHPDDVGYLDPAGGVLRTEVAVIGAVERAQRAGATVHPGTPITSVDARGRQVVLRSATEKWSYDDVVVCAGAWSRPLLAGGIGQLVRPLRICLTWYAARRPEDFRPERFPAFVRHSREVHLYGTPTFDGSLVKAAGVIPSVPLESLDDFERDVSRQDRDLTSEAVRRFLPGLHPSCVRSDSYLDLCTEDSRPIVGPDPGRRGVYVATGFSGRGFKMSTGVAEAVAEELTTGRRPTRLAVASLGRFQSTRYALRAGAPPRSARPGPRSPR